MLFGPTDLFEFREAITFCISHLLAELEEKEF